MTAAERAEPTSSERSPKPQSRVERKRIQRTENILYAAGEALGRKGISGFSLEELAETLDVTKGSLYHYFPSKEELVLSSIEMLASRIMVDLRRAVDETEGTATERFRALLAKQISVVVWDYPSAIELFTLSEPADAARRVKALRASHDALFRTVLEEGLAAGEFRVASVSASLECIFSATNMSPLWISGTSPRSAQTKIDELTDTLLMLVGVLPVEATN